MQCAKLQKIRNRKNPKTKEQTPWLSPSLVSISSRVLKVTPPWPRLPIAAAPRPKTSAPANCTTTAPKSHQLAHSEILLPDGAHESLRHRENLWNLVEKSEHRKDSQLAKDVVLALPKELTAEQRVELAQRFAITHFVSKGVAVDLNIHADDPNNPHAHLLITTRRVEGRQLSAYKARDLNPAFAHAGGRALVLEGDHWGEKWREMQNTYFVEKGIALEVDANHVVPEVHLGKAAHAAANDYRQAQNEARHEASQEITRNDPDALLNLLALREGVFNETMVRKTVIRYTDAPHVNEVLDRIHTSKELLPLGHDANGHMQYTTKSFFEVEASLQDSADILHTRSSHALGEKAAREHLAQTALSPEQREAMTHLLTTSDVGILVGRAGTGKSTALKAAREAWENAGYQVQGVALAGIAAQNLKQGSGLQSRTLASWFYSVENNRLPLNKNHVVVLDEAGMVDSWQMSRLIRHVEDKGAKLVLVGDPQQLQPIDAGAPLRAIAERVGFASLETIYRQDVDWQKAATKHFARGEVKEALQLYSDHKQIHWRGNRIDAKFHCLNEWNRQTAQGEFPLLLAYHRADVATLNFAARAHRHAQGRLQEVGQWQTVEGKINIALGDRILMRSNDRRKEVWNGDLGTVVALDKKGLQLKLDRGQTITLPPTYQNIEYGYALTVHKSQGVTVNNSILYVNGKWDAHLSYVAWTRHRQSCQAFVARESYKNFDMLATKLNQSNTKDSVLDYPLQYAARRGLDIQWLWDRLITHLRQQVTRLKTFWQGKSETPATETKDPKQQAALHYAEKRLEYQKALQKVITSGHSQEAKAQADAAYKSLQESVKVWHKVDTSEPQALNKQSPSFKESLAQAKSGKLSEGAYHVLRDDMQHYHKQSMKESQSHSEGKGKGRSV